MAILHLLSMKSAATKIVSGHALLLKTSLILCAFILIIDIIINIIGGRTKEAIANNVSLSLSSHEKIELSFARTSSAGGSLPPSPSFVLFCS